MNGIISKIKEHKVGIIYYFLLVLLTGAIGYISLGQDFDFNVFPNFEGDGIFGLALVKGIQENGPFGVWHNSRIGAPGVSSMIDYPVLGNIMVFLIWIISWFVKSTPAIMYIYLILTFILDGVGMSMLLRKININREISFVVSILFSCAPFHFYRYLGHSSLINYMYVPIAVYLSLYIVGYIKEEKKWKLAVCALVLGFGYGYYYAFGLIMMAVAYVVKFIRIENKKDILKDIWIIIVVLLTVFITLLPKIVFSLMNGGNPEVGIRGWQEQEIYGLKIINLLLPVSYSRIDSLKSITNEYITTAPLVTENHTASLGLVASIGFIGLCIAFFISFSNKRKCDGRQWVLIDFLALSTLVFVLMGSIGGFGEIFNWAITSQIRCYNRSSIVIMALSLMFIAIVIENYCRKKKEILYSVCAIVLCVGMFDQINICSENWQGWIRNTQEGYEDFFNEVEESLAEQAKVYQLPYVEFPEAGNVNNMGDYRHFVAYLMTDDLLWSYGGIRGRNLEAKNLNIDDGMSYEFLDGLKQSGFEAVYIDVNGYADGGVQILSFYNSTGIEPIVSMDGKLYVYDISNYEIENDSSIKGYVLLKSWVDKYEIVISNDELKNVAINLMNNDKGSIDVIYSWFINDPIVTEGTNEEFIDFMYQSILGRTADVSGKESWMNVLETGAERKIIFESFLNSDEFRNSQGY